MLKCWEKVVSGPNSWSLLRENRLVVRNFVLAGLAVFCLVANADEPQSFGTVAEAQAMMSRFLDLYVKGDQSEAFRNLPRMTTSRTDEEQRQQIQKFVQWNAQTSEKRGSPISYRLVSSKVLSDVVARERYIVLTERLPLTFDFFLYRTSPQERWGLADVQLINGAAKLFANEEQ